MSETKINHEQFFDELNMQAEIVRRTGKNFHKRYQTNKVKITLDDQHKGSINGDFILNGEIIDINLQKNRSWITIEFNNRCKITFTVKTGSIMADSTPKMVIHTEGDPTLWIRR